MFSYTIRRLLGAIPTLLLIVTIAFVMVRATPGGPFSSERRLPAEVEANLRAKYHLDEPIIVQYFSYLGQVLQGDFGPSFKYKDFTVNELIWSGFKVSVVVGSAALLLAVVVGTTIGTLAALRQNTALDYSVMATAMTGITIPNFVMAPLLTLILGVHLGWLPVGGWGSPRQAILPIVTLALPQIAYVARMSRASMIEVLRSNFVRTARAKGLPERITVTRHALKPALMPVVSYLGPLAAYLITGSVVIEVIFGIPGVGRYFIQGALNRDYTLVLGVVVFYGALIILFNLLVDLLYGFLDPKVRYD
ncbi:MAG TPA: oligopeptide ABC transporter permease OppB [Alphaproteobacteria bacterium]|nr:oligopeptide ABC transporter permease OppB [Alphaproteobacteria bacterium]